MEVHGCVFISVGNTLVWLCTAFGLTFTVVANCIIPLLCTFSSSSTKLSFNSFANWQNESEGCSLSQQALPVCGYLN